jgi:hypothetical protein
LLRSRDSSVGVVTAWAAWVRFPAGAKFFSAPQRPDRLWGASILLSNGYRGEISPEVKRPGREADHLLPSTAEVKDGGAIPPFPHVLMAQFLIKYTDSFTFFFHFLHPIAFNGLCLGCWLVLVHIFAFLCHSLILTVSNTVLHWLIILLLSAFFLFSSKRKNC